MRRAFLKGLALGSVAWRDALAAEAPGEKTRQVASVEVFRVEGRREEHFDGRWEVDRYLRARALHVVQADPEWCGGVSELVKIATLASAHDAHVVPHGHALHAALHVIASQSPATCPMGECLLVKMTLPTHPWYFCHFEKEPLRIEKGEALLTERPGFGIELDPAKVEKQTARAPE